MEIRKIQKTGVSTMTVSLPKRWVQEQGLKQGDPLEVNVLRDGSLSLNSVIGERDEQVRKIVNVDKDEVGQHLMRKLIAAYLAGYDIIEVRSTARLDYELKREIKEFSRLVIGPEVIEETSNSIVLLDLSDPAELPQRKCVRRMHLLVNSMHRDAITAFEENDDSLARDVIDRDLDVDRLYLMVVKQYNLILKDRRISEKIGVDVFEGMNLMLAARLIERIGDHAEKIARTSLMPHDEGDDKMRKNLRGLSERAVKILDNAVESLFKRDIDEANLVIDEGSKLVEDCELLKPGGDIKGCTSLNENTILDSILRTAMYSIDIAETAINLTINKD
ncbi:MAG: phosphate uptake regulator PhoU [Methanomassiliicoccales archaeon]|nr:phosphate uptake regulator PhoU [Methanomassiliicoccales archaeon]NYT14535.1 phosphate uptake regulator PhoU [Methanomassiliicoccales archaeon]